MTFKNIFIIFLTTLFCSVIWNPTVHSGTKNTLTVSYRTNPSSVHYEAPIIADITNNSQQTLSYSLPAGTLLAPSDSQCQTMVITETVAQKIAPNSKKQLVIKAMCTQSYKAGAKEGIQYHQIPSNPLLTSLALFIDSNKYQNSEAQHAVWTMQNKSPLYEIYGADTVAALRLQQKIAALTGQIIPQKLEIQNYSYNYYATPPSPKTTLGGSFDYQLSRQASISIGMFNDQGVLVRELFKNTAVKPGAHTFKYEFDASVYTEDEYSILFIRDGKIMLKQELPMANWKKQFMEQQRRN